MSKVGGLLKEMDSIKSLEKKIVTFPVEVLLKQTYQNYRDKAETGSS